MIQFSIDGIDDVGEYVRYGFNMKRFTKNLKLWMDYISNHKNPESKFRYHFVVHIMNVLNLQKTYDYLTQWGCKYFDLSMLHRPKYLNIAYLPNATKDWILDRVKGQRYEQHIKLHLSKKEYDEKHIDDFFIFSDFIEQRRNKLPIEIEEIYMKTLLDHQKEKRNK